MDKKKLSPSTINKLLFADAFENIPPGVLKKAAEFGSTMHKCFEFYATYPDHEDIIQQLLTTYGETKKWDIFLEGKKWFTSQFDTTNGDIEAHVENETLNMHGYIDAIDYTNQIFYDYKLRNVDSKLDVAKDIFQMVMYEMIINFHKTKKGMGELIIIDKKKFEIYILRKSDIDIKVYASIGVMLERFIFAMNEFHNLNLKLDIKDKKGMKILKR